ncbi:MAG: transcription antitermination factor NusB [Nitrospirae bacterium]|nr:transcription antitermination factor NusB [Nitrospirota bacterium]
MKRRRAREYVLQILFQLEITGNKLSDDELKEFWKGKDEAQEVKEFTQSIVIGTLENIASLDEIIKNAAEHWSLDRMAVIDKNILRAAAYELVYRADIPTSVVINEALEIAKKYSTEESASFLNGILDKIAKEKKTAGKQKKPVRKKKD